VVVGGADIWSLFLAAVMVLAIALYPACANMADASWSKSRGCTFAATLHIISLLAWPLALQFAGGLYWLAPATALSSLILLASCWSGPPRVVYRMGVQGVIIAALAVQQGTATLMGA
jgi:hypothetical protein